MWIDIRDTNADEKLLWVGVMRRAVSDYILYKGKKRFEIRWRRANAYLFENENDDSDQLSFENVCHLFGWEPGYIRRIIKTLNREDVRKLESISKFSEEFRADTDHPSIVQEEEEEIENYQVPTSMFKRFRYSRAYREAMTPRSIAKPLCAPPLVAWSSSR